MNTCSSCGAVVEKFYNKSKRCQPCRTKEHREYCRRTDYHKKRYVKVSAAERERHLIKKYGITEADYQGMLDSQNGECAICGRSQDKSFDVDHDHETGNVRGLLCTNCNRMIGYAHDDPERLETAAEYLRSSRKSRQK